MDPKAIEIYFPCRQFTKPTGGVQMIYRQVDLLNQSGFSAAVLHREAEFRCQWFPNKTRILGGILTINPDLSIVVVPEVYEQAEYAKLPKDIPFVIFNQNVYYTFEKFSVNFEEEYLPYADPNLLGVIVVSEDSKNYIQTAFPQVKVHRVRCSVDPELFYFPERKTNQICFLARKNFMDVQQVCQILRHRDRLQGFQLVRVLDLPQAKLAEMMRNSAIFMSFGDPEGFGLPAAEAMAAGCLTVGYHGRGGREFFKPEFSYPIERGDILGFVQAVEQAIDDWVNRPEATITKVKQASAYIRSTYSLANQTDDVVAAWSAILGRFPGQSLPKPPNVSQPTQDSSQPTYDLNQAIAPPSIIF